MAWAFLNGFLSTLIVGAVTRFAGQLFASDKAVRIGAFCVALGFAGGRFSYSGPATIEAALTASAVAGAAAALVLLWAWLLRKAAGAPTRDSD